MAEIVKRGQWRHANRIIYVRGDGEYADDREIGWASSYEDAEKICKEHNKTIKQGEK